MKKIIASVLLLGLSLTTTAFTDGDQLDVMFNALQLQVNGQAVQADNFMYRGTTYVPLRKTAEMLGQTVGWDDSTHTASIDGGQDQEEHVNGVSSADYPIDYKPSGRKLKIQALDLDISRFDGHIATEHFDVYYHRTGSAPVSEEYAHKVSDSAEKAYRVYFTDMGIDMPLTGKLPVAIDSLQENDGTGVATSMVAGDNLIMRIVMGQQIKEDEIGPTMYHELFHIIQSYYYYMSDTFLLVEAVPSAAAYAVEPVAGWQAQMSLDHYFANPDYFLSGERNSTVLLMIYLYEKYGLSFKRLLEAEASGYKDVDALRAVLAEKGVTFEEAYENYAADVFADNFLALDLFDETRNKAIMATGSWNGEPTELETHSKDWFWDRMVKRKGSPLEVVNTYGSEYVEIVPQSDQSLSVSVDNSNLTFSVIGIAEDGHGERLDRVIEKPDRYKRIILAVTKVKSGDGQYRVLLR